MKTLKSVSGKKEVRFVLQSDNVTALFNQITCTGIDVAEDLIELKRFAGKNKEDRAVKWGCKMLGITTEMVDNCRKEHTKLIGRYDNDSKRFPVIVDTFGAGCLGVQFWTESEVKKGILINTDRSTSTFVEKL